MSVRLALLPILFILAGAILGCATPNVALEDGRQLISEGRFEEGLARLEQASKAAPADKQLRAQYVRQRDLIINQFLAQSETLRLANQYDAAEALYRRVLAIDPKNGRALSGIRELEADRRHVRLIEEADALYKKKDVAEARRKLREVLAENPKHRDASALQRIMEEDALKASREAQKIQSAFSRPITLEFRDANLRTVFEAISRTANINFVFDRDVRPDLRTTIFLRDTAIDEAIRALLVTNQLERKTLNANTVLVYPNTPQKQKDYQELMIKSFYLGNADVKQTLNLLRTVIKARDVFVEEKLNMLVVRDTPEQIALVEKLIAAHDLAEPEVILEVEVLEVSTSRLQELGLRFPDQVSYSLSSNVLEGAERLGGTITLPEWQNRDSSLVRMSVTNPFFVINLRQLDGTTSLLANPRIRVKNREKARVHIGDRVPVITTTAAASGGFVSESVSYLDVGLKLEVEPNIHLENEVGIKVGLEVSNIVREVRGGSTSSNTLTYQIGTRNASTVLRLKDGETQVLAGLISDEDRRTANKVPGLGDLPGIGRLFSSNRGDAVKTEVVLLITPYVVRTLARPEARVLEFAAGTESASGTGAFGTGATTVKPAAVKPAPPTAPPAGGMVPFGGVGGFPRPAPTGQQLQPR